MTTMDVRARAFEAAAPILSVHVAARLRITAQPAGDGDSAIRIRLDGDELPLDGLAATSAAVAPGRHVLQVSASATVLLDGLTVTAVP
ncbi:hypothetical protein V6U81_02530 [Micromonospora sp. CPCC 205711]|uniref:hypothetical protein n=1 Tax=Micromonospora sp. CPCC 205547 TaxID=3122400 RepID=UPI002FF17A84